MTNTAQHITPETETLFKEFMAETDTLDTVNKHSKTLSTVSPSSLLEVLTEAKVLVDSLQSKNQSNDLPGEIISRLTRLETELIELKEIVSNQ